MKVTCIFPATNYEAKIPDVMREFKDKISSQLRFLGVTTPEMVFPRLNYIFVPTNQTWTGPPKGRGIIECIKNSPAPPPDYVLCCDASGKIPYVYIVDILKELISDSSTCCVMANRKGDVAICEERYFIERFEIFLLSKFHKHSKNIPDGQCGLWGFKYGKITVNSETKEISLTADGYEIELDLLSEVLEKGLQYSFVDVVLPTQPTQTTAFTYDNNINKLKFLIRKYSGLRSYMKQFRSEFETIPANAAKLNGNIKDYWERYKKDALEVCKL